LQLKQQSWHCWTISFPPCVPNEWCYTVLMAYRYTLLVV
jgi:hypothetical protein